MTVNYIYRITLLLIGICLLLSCSNPKNRHLGEWGNQDDGRNWLVKFTADSLVEILDDNIPVLGGPFYKLNDGQPGTCKYEIDYSKNPVWLDVVVFPKGQKKEIGRLKGIVRFLSADKMEWRINPGPGGERFNNFENLAPNEVTKFKRVITKR